MIKSKEQAERVQLRRAQSHRAGVAKAVRRWNKRNPGQRVTEPNDVRIGDGGDHKMARGKMCRGFNVPPIGCGKKVPRGACNCEISQRMRSA